MATHLSRIARISCCCWAEDRSRRDGQSMLPTVATQTPRNSRFTGGGSSAACGRAIEGTHAISKPTRRNRRIEPVPFHARCPLVVAGASPEDENRPLHGRNSPHYAV